MNELVALLTVVNVRSRKVWGSSFWFWNAHCNSITLCSIFGDYSKSDGGIWANKVRGPLPRVIRWTWAASMNSSFVETVFWLESTLNLTDVTVYIVNDTVNICKLDTRWCFHFLGIWFTLCTACTVHICSTSIINTTGKFSIMFAWKFANCFNSHFGLNPYYIL